MGEFPAFRGRGLQQELGEQREGDCSRSWENRGKGAEAGIERTFRGKGAEAGLVPGVPQNLSQLCPGWCGLVLSQGGKVHFPWSRRSPAAHGSSDNLPLCLAARASVPVPPLEGHPGAEPALDLQQRQGFPAAEELGLPQQRGSPVSIPEPSRASTPRGHPIYRCCSCGSGDTKAGTIPAGGSAPVNVVLALLISDLSLFSFVII